MVQYVPYWHGRVRGISRRRRNGRGIAIKANDDGDGFVSSLAIQRALDHPNRSERRGAVGFGVERGGERCGVVSVPARGTGEKHSPDNTLCSLSIRFALFEEGQHGNH